jgi:hypothetical protein
MPSYPDMIESYHGLIGTLHEMSYPDWKRRLRRARWESQQCKGLSLDAYLERRAGR